MATESGIGVRLAERAVTFEPADAWQRLGLVALATDLTTERDFARLLPHDQAALYTARIAFDNPTTPARLARMGARLASTAALLQAVEPLAAVCYSCTAASVVLGDAQVRDAIQSALPDVPVVTPSAAARLAFKALGAERIAVLTPYLVETTQPFVDYFTRHGFEIVNVECLGLDDDRLMARVRRADIIEAAVAVDRPEADVVFLSCTALPAITAIAEIESRIGKPVVTSNQASVWAMFAHAALACQPDGYGRLFTAPFPPSVSVGR